MSGSKTILGFTGNGPAANSGAGAEAGDPRACRTVVGRDVHRPAIQAEVPKAAPAQPAPAVARPLVRGPASSGWPARSSAASAIPTQVVEEVTEQIPNRSRPRHSEKNGPPALARLFGRWTTGGTFRRRSDLHVKADDDLAVPRDPWGKRLAILFGATLLSFLLALSVIRLHQCATARRSQSEPAFPSPATLAPAPERAQPAPVVPALAPPAPAGVPAAPAASVVESRSGSPRPEPSTTRAPGPRTAPARRTFRSASSPARRADPDSPLPVAW